MLDTYINGIITQTNSSSTTMVSGAVAISVVVSVSRSGATSASITIITVLFGDAHQLPFRFKRVDILCEGLPLCSLLGILIDGFAGFQCRVFILEVVNHIANHLFLDPSAILRGIQRQLDGRHQTFAFCEELLFLIICFIARHCLSDKKRRD